MAAVVKGEWKVGNGSAGKRLKAAHRAAMAIDEEGAHIYISLKEYARKANTPDAKSWLAQK